MGTLFGTDGIRGVAGEYPMTTDIAEKVGIALATYILENKYDKKIVIGRDTRISGPIIEDALTAGITSRGLDVLLSGVIPTPGVAYLAADHNAGAGIVVSASHNPYYDNGIKLFDKTGFKYPDETERYIETLVMALSRSSGSGRTGPKESGKAFRIDDGLSRYIEFLKRAIKPGRSLEGLKIVIDCSNGATHQVAPTVFSELGADIQAIGDSPSGENINEDCGSQHTDLLVQKVLGIKADMGIAFDGDGDRLIAVDEKGTVLTGDRVLAICARAMKEAGTLENNTVVSTVMSNMGLGAALKQLGIRHILSDVGDRYVVEQMRAHGAVLGGEDSGHMVFLTHHTTGDGILSALKLCDVLIGSNAPLSDIAKIMTVFPQVLLNVKVNAKPDLTTIPKIDNAIRKVKDKLGEEGRALVRYSGTEPLCRVMVEASSEKDAFDNCQYLSDIIEDTIG